MIPILLVDDDLTLSSLIMGFLSQHGFDPLHINRGDWALEAFRRHASAVVILDLSLPGRHGLDVCRDLRVISAVPILILSGDGGDPAVIQGLEAGADDYLVKPIAPQLLLARIRALLRRPGRLVRLSRRLEFGALVIDLDAYSVRLHGEPVYLTRMEFDVLWALASHAGYLLSRDALLEHAREATRASARGSIDVCVSKLRRKLEDGRPPAFRIKTIRGEGYMFVPRPEHGIG